MVGVHFGPAFIGPFLPHVFSRDQKGFFPLPDVDRFAFCFLTTAALELCAVSGICQVVS